MSSEQKPSTNSTKMNKILTDQLDLFSEPEKYSYVPLEGVIRSWILDNETKKA